LSSMADIMIAVFAMESALLRTKKIIAKSGEATAQNVIAMTLTFVHESFDQIEQLAKETLSAMESGDTLRTQFSVLKKLTKKSSLNSIELKRQISAQVIAAEKYVR
jgi:hypothetical protein